MKVVARIIPTDSDGNQIPFSDYTDMVWYTGDSEVRVIEAAVQIIANQRDAAFTRVVSVTIDIDD